MLGFAQNKIVPIQTSIVVLDYVDAIPDTQTRQGETPCVGHVWVYGMVYSDQAITLNIDQGVNDKGGVLVYRKTTTVAVAAGTAEDAKVPIIGKFVRVRLVNNSGFAANVEAFFAIRPYD